MIIFPFITIENWIKFLISPNYRCLYFDIWYGFYCVYIPICLMTVIWSTRLVFAKELKLIVLFPSLPFKETMKTLEMRNIELTEEFNNRPQTSRISFWSTILIYCVNFIVLMLRQVRLAFQTASDRFPEQALRKWINYGITFLQSFCLFSKSLYIHR